MRVTYWRSEFNTQIQYIFSEFEIMKPSSYFTKFIFNFWIADKNKQIYKVNKEIKQEKNIILLQKTFYI